MKSKILLSIILFSLKFTFSQQNIAFADQRVFSANSSSFLTIDNDNTVDIEGSKYIQDGFKPATISVYPNYRFNVKFNAFDDEMEIQGKNNKSFALNKNDKRAEVVFLNTKEIYGLYNFTNDNSQPISGYFQKVFVGKKVILLKKEKIMFVEEKQSKTGYDSYRPPQYKRLNDKFFIKQIDNDIALELPKNKKSIAGLFPNYESDILMFIKKNKLKTNNEVDLKKIIEFINIQ